ncbi:hypothetical protein F0A17_13455 [Billgrantia pellis]|uniref:Uncharacterized protein n=1 Tax=Billgrantia pellis TaxID=2606936 RepID=A0A7V7FXY3_9GAMM|nr:hypothetical protein [Halomonas pellis]KAA0011130.1 hypothetical protein F0A17_13455 [Halomonas pellis]
MSGIRLSPGRPHEATPANERANIADPRDRELADPIIESQREEIAGRTMLVEDLDDERCHPLWRER